MSSVDRDILIQTLRAVVDAELDPSPTTYRDNCFVSPMMQKVVLLALLSYEGEPVSGTGLAARIGATQQAILDTLNALVQEGLVIRRIEHRTKRRYTVCYRRLLELQTLVPIWQPSGGNKNAAPRLQKKAVKHRRKDLEPLLPREP